MRKKPNKTTGTVSVEFNDHVMNNGDCDNDVTGSDQYGLDNPAIIGDKETELAADTKM